jgi:hypothetical protein
VEHPEQAQDIKAHEQKSVTIIVNGRKKEFFGKEITFEQVVKLAFEKPPYGENTMFTVTYKRGHGDKEGSMLPGDSVKAKEGMVFNVTATDKS